MIVIEKVFYTSVANEYTYRELVEVVINPTFVVYFIGQFNESELVKALNTQLTVA